VRPSAWASEGADFGVTIRWGQLVFFRLFLQQPEIRPPIVIDKEHILPVIAPLRHMVWAAGDHDTSNSGHAGILAMAGGSVKRK